MRILVTGAPNIVKDSIVKIATEGFPGDLSILNFSDFADASSLKRELDFLKKTRESLAETLQLKLVEVKKKSRNVLVNGYCMVPTDLGYAPIITEKMIKVLAPDVIVSISVDPKALAGREVDEDLRVRQEIERDFSLAFSAHTGAVLRLMDSGPDGSRKGAAELSALLKDLVK